ncbi:hypothetical protein L1987_22028 [Smallanthus sonchifolius]|uniref:Uncharacterized protein n=1 Tax=Smallanthus sonchifolius TaxID=185202 RepID=A0ACB9IFI0_9ASTR|nr:hypothetical protein L1987_22028 [Smallanthus sonchifolius]
MVALAGASPGRMKRTQPQMIGKEMPSVWRLSLLHSTRKLRLMIALTCQGGTKTQIISSQFSMPSKPVPNSRFYTKVMMLLQQRNCNRPTASTRANETSGQSKDQQLSRDISKAIYYHALRASTELAEKEGTYETFNGSPVSKFK